MTRAAGSKVFVTPVAVWAALQLTGLTLICGGVRLWAHHPYPPESIAFPVFATAQLLAGTLLAVPIFPNPMTSAVQLCLMIGFLFTSTVLGDTPVRVAAPMSVLVILWFIGLAGLLRTSRSPVIHIIIQLSAVYAILLPAVIQYIANETGRAAVLESGSRIFILSIMLIGPFG